MVVWSLRTWRLLCLGYVGVRTQVAVGAEGLHVGDNQQHSHHEGPSQRNREASIQIRCIQLETPMRGPNGDIVSSVAA